MSDKLIACPKCSARRGRQNILDIEMRGNRVRGQCGRCRFTTGWVAVPGFRVPRAYLRERVLRVADAYRRLLGEKYVAAGLMGLAGKVSTD